MAKKATITRVTRNPKNLQGCIVALSNGDTLWLQTSYIQTVLSANFIDDVRPTAIIGTEVTYDMKKYVVGDLVFDRKGQVKDGETVKFSTNGERPINITFGDVEGHIGEFDKARMNANAMAAATVKVLGAKPMKPVAQVEQPQEAGTSAEVVAEPAEAPADEVTV